MRTIAAGEFKAKCLAVMDEVNATGESVVITKRGKPVVRLSSIDEVPQTKKSILGRLRHAGVIHGDIVSSEHTDEEWDRMANERWTRTENGHPG
jgi:prevent-host-death family protein